jgi:pimeloyl-ACP methyl ester carboxylesterase
VTLSIPKSELEGVKRANEIGRQPVVFLNSLWLLPSSWDRWMERFEEAGYTALGPGWPDDSTHDTIGQIADHYERIVSKLYLKPALVGHSFGGLLTEMLAGRGLSTASVAISPAPFRGVLPLSFSALKSAWPAVNDPANRNRAVPLTFDEFRYAFANTVSEHEAKELYESFAVPAPPRPIIQASNANLNPWTEAQVRQNPDRGPMLVIAGEFDHSVPLAAAQASFEIERLDPDNLTEYWVMRERGHSLTIDHGWSEVADVALRFVERHAPAAVRG